MPQDNRTRLAQLAVVLLWLLLGGVFLFTLANLFVYLVVPSDGAILWVRQGPLRVLQVAPGSGTLLQTDDIILQVQGHDLNGWLDHTWRTWPALVRRAFSPNPTIEITLERAGQIQELVVSLRARPGGSLRLQFLAHMIVGSAFLVVGGVILKFRPRDPVARLTVAIMGLLALTEQVNIMPLLGAEIAVANLWLFLPLRLFTRWFAYSAALHLALVFPTPKRWLQRLPQLPLVIYLLNPVITLAMMINTPGNLHDRHAAAYPWSKNVYIIYLLLTVVLLLHTYFTVKNRLVKTQLSWIGWGVALAVVPNVLLGDIPILLGRQSLLPATIGSLTLLIVPVVVAVAILRHQLWNIDLFIRASLTYSTLTVALALVYFLLTFFFIRLVGATTNEPANTLRSIHFAAALTVVFLFAPTYQYFQRLIDRLFYRSEIDYGRVLAELSRELSTSLLLENVMRLLHETIPERLQIEQAQVLLHVTPPPNSAEYERLKSGHLIFLHHIDGRPHALPYPLDKLQVQKMWACAPLLSGDKLLGLYGVGKKKSGKYYNAKEISLIETLARQAGVALQNAQLHRELADQARFKSNLEMARQMQESLLPNHDPIVPQLDIAGFSLPAQLVGGDFYHYFEFAPELTGIAVGDVSGKGLSAALLMAVSISTLRAQGPDAAHNAAALLSKMNNLLQAQMRISRVNVAMIYAIIEREGHDRLKFRVSNAGLISPILLRPGQSCEFLDACGLPMGIIEEARYYECCFQLCPGDLIILGSDGIVEAMNEKRELFGFERFEQLINNTPDDISAAQFLDRLKREVQNFTGASPQHDDMTVVAIRVQ